MIYTIENGLLAETDVFPGDTIDFQPCFCLLTKKELLSANSYLHLSSRLLEECLKGTATKYENHEGFDYISLNIPNASDPIAVKDHICIYFRENLLAFCCDFPEDSGMIKETFAQIELEAMEVGNLTLEKILRIFFDKLTYYDALIFERLEEEVSDLEEDLITSRKRDYIKEIIFLRKRIMSYKHYYDQLSSITEAIEENENKLLAQVRYFHIITNKVERFLTTIDNLQDYLSQVREAYQTQVDINQNSIMKLFTVITAIFLPLTLIVGWYGMNFDMPEYKWSLGYPAVIVLCVCVALVSIYYFKRHKWF